MDPLGGAPLDQDGTPGAARSPVAAPPPPPDPPSSLLRFDAASPVPPLPPPLAPQPPPPPLASGMARLVPAGAPVSEAVLAIPLGIRELVRQSLDLLTRRDTGLRGASFYIGFILLITFGPMAVIMGLAFTLPGVMEPGPLRGTGVAGDVYAPPDAWPAWLLLAAIPAILGYIAAGTEARSMATAVIGGRVEGRPLRLRESISVARRRFWFVLGAQLLLGVISGIASVIGRLAVLIVFGNTQELDFAVSLVISVLISAPLVYVPAGIILGEVGVFEAIARSFRLVRMRKRLAIVVTLFGVLSQFIILLGLSTGLDVVARLVIGAGLADAFPRPLVVPIAAALVFALGTLTFLVEAIAAAPAVHAFAALTHYTHGLQVGRDQPAGGHGLWDPWMTPGLLLVSIIGLLALAGAILSFPG